MSANLRPSSMIQAGAWMGVALASFTLVAITGRAAARGATTIELMFHRAWPSLLTLVVWGLATGTIPSIFKTSRLTLHSIRALTHFGGQFSWLYALPLIPLAQLFSLEFTAPLWIVVLAPLLLGERLNAARLMAAGLGFAGALVAIRPDRVAIGTGEAMALVSAVGFALSMMCTKSLTTSEPPLRILFFMFLLQTGIALVVGGTNIRLPDAPTALWIGGLAASGFVAHYALVRAFTCADAIIVAPMDFLRLPLIAVVGVVIYGEALDPIALIGAVIVLAANFINLWVEHHVRKNAA